MASHLGGGCCPMESPRQAGRQSTPLKEAPGLVQPETAPRKHRRSSLGPDGALWQVKEDGAPPGSSSGGSSSVSGIVRHDSCSAEILVALSEMSTVSWC